MTRILFKDTRRIAKRVCEKKYAECVWWERERERVIRVTSVRGVHPVISSITRSPYSMHSAQCHPSLFFLPILAPATVAASAALILAVAALRSIQKRRELLYSLTIRSWSSLTDHSYIQTCICVYVCTNSTYDRYSSPLRCFEYSILFSFRSSSVSIILSGNCHWKRIYVRMSQQFSTVREILITVIIISKR